jgi:type I restriction enzyme S subunit
MNNKIECTVMPELRFPKFRASEQWKETTLAQVVNYENGKPHEQDISEDGKYIVVNSKFISTNGKKKKFTNSPNLLASKGDILMVLSDVPNGRAISKCFFVDEDNKYTVNQRVCKLTVTGVNNILLYYLLNRNSYFLEFDDGVKQTNLKKDDVLNCPLILPSLPKEQQVIGELFNSTDNLIDLQTYRLEIFKNHRKGLLQNMFPVDDETLPKNRFPEFENHAVWKKKAFSKLFTIGGGKDHKHLPDGDIPVYGSGGYMRSANEYLYNGESACIGRKGTINKPMFLTGKFWTVDTLFYTHSFKDCLPKFIYLLFQNINWLALNEAGGVPSLSKIIINKVEVMIPDIDEQQKIVNCIFTLDETIEQQKNKVEALKNHKRGLMQQLLSSTEALKL